MTFEIHHGDCLEVLAGLAAESLEACVCDPPYGIRFMGKAWDGADIEKRVAERRKYHQNEDPRAGHTGGHNSRAAEAGKYDRGRVANVAFQEFMGEVFAAVFRVLKPGGHLLAFGGTRTFHRLACGIEDAGFEMRDTLGWLYGSGFPKSLDVSKAMDKAAGAERQVVGNYGRSFRPHGNSGNAGWVRPSHELHGAVTQPSTLNAQRWSGWGTALKPAWEPIILARKPLCGTVAQNVLRYGTGAVNVDGCRVGAEGATTRSHQAAEYSPLGWSTGHSVVSLPKGRWPANVLHDGSAEVLEVFPQTGPGAFAKVQHKPSAVYGQIRPREIPERITTDAGSAARFFYCAKASKHDREEGLDGFSTNIVNRYGEQGQGPLPQQTPRRTQANRNHHPTVKPTKLMRYLCRLVTPPGGTVLDPFAGSGSTGKAALLEGFNFVGIEREAEYVAIARARCAHAAGLPSTPPLPHSNGS
jgi:DNA modification methylase